mgnify:FL=1
MLNRPSWLLGKWRLVNEFLNKSYRANEWIEKIEFQSSSDSAHKLVELGLNDKYILWFQFIVFNGLHVAFWVNTHFTCEFADTVDGLFL